MDSVYNSGGRIRKINSLNDVISQQQLQLNTESPLMKYLLAGSPITSSGSDRSSSSAIRTTNKGSSSGSRSINSGSSGSGGFRRSALSPLAAVENLKSPMVVEDDVLVMDEIQVASLPPGAKVSKSLSSSSSSGGTSSKTELCIAWENGQRCRFGSTCQFAHGQEQLLPSSYFPSSNIDKPELTQSGKSYAAAVAAAAAAVARRSSALYGPRCRFLPPVKAEPAVTSASPTVSSPTTRYEYWSPKDDGIKVALPSQSEKCPSREEVDAHIHSVLYGPSTRKRLPVFTEFCP